VTKVVGVRVPSAAQQVPSREIVEEFFYTNIHLYSLIVSVLNELCLVYFINSINPSDLGYKWKKGDNSVIFNFKLSNSQNFWFNV